MVGKVTSWYVDCVEDSVLVVVETGERKSEVGPASHGHSFAPYLSVCCDFPREPVGARPRLRSISSARCLDSERREAGLAPPQQLRCCFAAPMVSLTILFEQTPLTFQHGVF